MADTVSVLIFTKIILGLYQLFVLIFSAWLLDGWKGWRFIVATIFLGIAMILWFYGISVCFDIVFKVIDKTEKHFGIRQQQQQQEEQDKTQLGEHFGRSYGIFPAKATSRHKMYLSYQLVWFLRFSFCYAVTFVYLFTHIYIMDTKLLCTLFIIEELLLCICHYMYYSIIVYGGTFLERNTNTRWVRFNSRIAMGREDTFAKVQIPDIYYKFNQFALIPQFLSKRRFPEPIPKFVISNNTSYIMFAELLDVKEFYPAMFGNFQKIYPWTHGAIPRQYQNIVQLRASNWHQNFRLEMEGNHLISYTHTYSKYGDDYVVMIGKPDNAPENFKSPEINVVNNGDYHEIIVKPQDQNYLQDAEARDSFNLFECMFGPVIGEKSSFY